MFLFTNIKDIFERYDLLELFIKKLENFILCNRVNQLDKQTINQILQYYDVIFRIANLKLKSAEIFYLKY